METSSSDTTNLEPSSLSTRSDIPRALQLSNLRLLQTPFRALVEFSGMGNQTRPDHSYHGAQPLVDEANNMGLNSDADAVDGGGDGENGSGNINNGEVSIRIIGGGNGGGGEGGVGMGMGEGGVEGESGGSNAGSGNSENTGDSTPPPSYDIQQAARWAEQMVPFVLLLLVVFIKQHLQGFVVAVYVTAILFKSNDILRKQTALKGERRMLVLIGYSILFMLQVFGIYWWDRNEDLFYPMIMIPPNTIPPFWHAMFIILVNDTMVRQAGMVLKLVILMYYKNGRGHNFRRQGQMLTLIEYAMLFYRALLPAPVWYRFFLNKEYGSLFSSITTGLYLTFKLTSIVEKVKNFYTAFKALSRKEVHYGSHATPEQVNAAGDLCAICQEKMHTPIILRCKHIFCEDCVSEWFDRERTCPLCRAMVRPADLRSYGDGSTSLYCQLF